MNDVSQREEKVAIAIEIAIKLGLLAIALYVSFLIIKPFIGVVLWGIIIAVAISPLVNQLTAKFGSQKKVVIGLTLVVIAALLIPTYMLSDTILESSEKLAHAAKEGVTIPAPTEKVKEWPLIGNKTYNLWLSASQDLPHTLEPFKDDIKDILKKIASSFASGIATVFMFVFSMIIAAALLIGSKESVKFYQDVMRRLMGEKGLEWAELSTLTVRSVVNGVIGIAVIQSALALIGLVLMGIPFAPVLALAIMFLTIIQLPALIIIGPVIAYVFSQGSGTPEIIFAVYMLIVGASDGVLKPILLGRGVDIPMLVILIGAIGGMILMGMIGLFVGAVILALTYKLFELWISEVREAKEIEA